MAARYALGLDFGTESGRAILVDLVTGRIVASAVHAYEHGVIDRSLPAPDDDVALEPEWALQDPHDYLETLRRAVPEVLRAAGAEPTSVVGVGVAFTSCTMLPTTGTGVPLCQLPELRREPHAWPKLWKHHAAQPEADRINEAARARGEPWLARYGGATSSEWFFAKSLQILAEAPAVYRAAERLIEAGDWLVWQLTGVEQRSSCIAGYKALWSPGEGFPGRGFFEAVDPGLATVLETRMHQAIAPLGSVAGEVSAEAAKLTGLAPGTPVAVAVIDAHASVPAATVTEPGRLVAVMGTSTCHLLLGTDPVAVEGIAGVVEDGIVPGFWGYEAGQAGVGDLFGWYVARLAPGGYPAGAPGHAALERDAAALRPGEHGLVALDWWNGNRSVLVDADLSGLLVGATLATDAAAIYRALLEATAFGTRMIIEAFEAAGLAVNEIIACGGLAERNRLLLQIYADVTGRVFRVAGTSQASALGAALHGAVAAGPVSGFASLREAAAALTSLRAETIVPDTRTKATYDALFEIYREFHDHFGRGSSDAMHRLRRLREAALADRAGSRLVLRRR
jgi:L-ribulokinase